MNNCSFVGRIGRLEEKATRGGEKIAKFSLAVQKSREETVWINCVAFRKNAEFIMQWFAKGDVIAVSASYSPSEYEKDGVKVLYPEFAVNNANFVPGTSRKEHLGQPEDEEAVAF